ncbi:AAA family ATPase [Muricoccus radiodurans]|uniref:bifunctional aminoglycoside phosphotransferase/ATP-binding protein n=1 Tax=Muricoccus radiodurans TaxID=2231721 RepID=UPI003CF5E33F
MTVPAEQAAAAALLARLTGSDAPVETHVSAVFVGRDRVLKLKKAVNLGFLDFTAPEARRRYAERELELNAPAAPGLYRAVHGIPAGADRLVPADDPRSREWVLEMAPFPPEDVLDAVAAAGGITPAMQDALGDAFAALSAACPVVPDVDAPARFAAVLRGNARAALSAGLPAQRVVAWRRAAEATRRRLAPFLARRAGQGFLRRGHGDLHLGNVVLWTGRPTAFDALEFDEALATIDTGYDLAFLLADLLRRCGRDAANRVMNRAIARTGDTELVTALPLWLSTRALIRAHCLARLPDAQEMAHAFLSDAESHLGPAPPRIVAIGGLQGTGKTHLARRLAPILGAAPGALHLRTDEIRKRLAGLPPETGLPAEAYSPENSALVHDLLFAQAESAARAGHAVVTDATFLNPAMRAGIEASAARAGVPFTGLWLEAPRDILRARLDARQGDASDATAAVMEAAARVEVGTITWPRLDAAADPLQAALSLAQLRER